ncbi:MAG: sugar ABC transporter permease [Betaproteobacteria bacterium]|nr:sugar ABC transporter permease [Betaproteobacteria bacterium]
MNSTPTAQRSLFDRLADMDERMLAVCLLAPAFIFISIIVVYPVATLVWNSFNDVRLLTGKPARFAGIENYLLVMSDAQFWRAVRNTLIIVFVTVPGALVCGLALAMLANMPFKSRGPIRLALLLPWAMPLAFVGLIFAWFFNSEYGVINDVLRRFGMQPQIWFNSGPLTLMAICIATIWKTSSFMALILLAGLQTIPKSLYEAAEVDGASHWRQFTDITLPLLVPSMLVALIFRTLTAIQSFDIPYSMPGPGEETQTLAMYIHMNAVDYLDLGYSSALAVVMFGLSMATTFVYLKYVRAEGK